MATETVINLVLAWTANVFLASYRAEGGFIEIVVAAAFFTEIWGVAAVAAGKDSFAEFADQIHIIPKVALFACCTSCQVVAAKAVVDQSWAEQACSSRAASICDGWIDDEAFYAWDACRWWRTNAATLNIIIAQFAHMVASVIVIAWITVVTFPYILIDVAIVVPSKEILSRIIKV